MRDFREVVAYFDGRRYKKTIDLLFVTRKQRVLVIEDHTDTRMVLEKLLETRFFQVFTAATCAQAMAVFRSEEIDVVICDIGLPDGSGYELIPALNAIRPTKSVAMAGYGAEEDRAKCATAGFDLYLLKPVTMEDVETALNHLSEFS